LANNAQNQKLSPLLSMAKNDHEKNTFHHWYPWPKRLKNQKLSPLVTLAKNDQEKQKLLPFVSLAKNNQEYFFENE